MKHCLVITVFLFVASCGGQVGEEGGIACKAATEQVLAADELSPLGFTGQDVLDVVLGTHTETLTWADDLGTVLTVTVSYDGGAIRFLDREWLSDNPSTLIEPALGGCEDIIAMELVIAVATDDGELDESWILEVTAETASQIFLTHDLATLAGSLDIERFAPDTAYNSARGWIDLSVTELGISGGLSGQVEGEDGMTAFAQSFDIATVGSTE